MYHISHALLQRRYDPSAVETPETSAPTNILFGVYLVLCFNLYCGCFNLFGNVWVCVCVGFVMCGCVYVWVCVCVGFVVCGCVCVGVL
jgi:hypothetical protein